MLQEKLLPVSQAGILTNNLAQNVFLSPQSILSRENGDTL